MKVAGRRRERWRRSRNIWGRRRDTDSALAGGDAVAAVAGVWVGGSNEARALRERTVKGEAAERRGRQRGKYLDRWDREDADGDVAGGEIFGRGKERRDFDARVQGFERNER